MLFPLIMRILAIMLVLLTNAARASDGLLFSTPLILPVTISGSEVLLESLVIRPDRLGRFPLIIIVHGTPSAEGEAFFREILNRSPVAYSNAAAAFCSAPRRKLIRHRLPL